MALSHLSDTLAAEGNGEGGANDTDVNTWLSKNRLKKFKPYFEENEIILDDLLTYNEKEIDAVINECNITATAYQKRFKDAVRDLQFKSNKKNNNTSVSSNQIYRVVMSTEESQLMKELENKLTQINEWIEINQNEMNKLSKNIANCENGIKYAFIELRKQLDEREKSLNRKLNGISNDHTNRLKNQTYYLNQCKESLNNAQKEQNCLLLDPNIDSTKRESKIEKITNETLYNINENKTECPIAEIKCIINTKLINEYISNIGVISSASDPPTLKITNIKSQEAKVTIEIIECKVNDDKTQYNLKYKSIDNNDDEKKLDWNEININNNNEYVLKGLQKKTKYEICGKYKTSKDELWSIYSQKVIFQTLDEIIQPKDEWDINCKGLSCEVKGNIVNMINNGWCTIWLKQIVSKGKHQWKFKIIKDMKSYPNFYIGITNDVDKKQTNGHLTKYVYKSQCNTTCSKIYDGQTNGKEVNQSAKEGDVITMCLDFETKQLTFMLNGSSVGEAVNVYDGEYRAAVSLWGTNNSIALV